MSLSENECTASPSLKCEKREVLEVKEFAERVVENGLPPDPGGNKCLDEIPEPV